MSLIELPQTYSENYHLPSPNSDKSGYDFAKWAIRKGWKVIHRGWPDFLCTKKDDLMLVEAKANPFVLLDERQLSVMKTLSSTGIPCFRWDSFQGLAKFDKIQEPNHK